VIRKVDLVRAEILRLIDEAKDSGDHEELLQLEKELQYLETHRDEY